VAVWPEVTGGKLTPASVAGREAGEWGGSGKSRISES